MQQLDSINLSLASLPLDELLEIQAARDRGEIDDTQAGAGAYVWPTWARPEQRLPSGHWRYWLVKAGRGWGKTRTGVEAVRAWAEDYEYINLIGATADDARDIMIEGESGILACCPKDNRPEYKKSDRQLIWPSGAKSLIFTADEPDRLRGKQHEKLWADELAAWRYPKAAWDQAMLGLRLGDNPQAVITTTPRAIPIVRSLMADPLTVISGGSTYDNAANLAPGFLHEIIRQYEGTRLGRQELLAEILEDNPGALWKRAELEQHRVVKMPELVRIVVAIDPSATSKETSDEAGIVAAGLGIDGHGYPFDDLTLRGTPLQWARQAVTAYHTHKADRIVAEVNNGGEMVELTIRVVDPDVAYKPVHASRGKQTRAEPVAALYEQGRVHHVGALPQLEDELCQWEPGMASPNRLDALVWALSELMLETGERQDIAIYDERVEISPY